MCLTCQPESEAFIWAELLDFFLEAGQPGCHQVQVLKADPFAFLCCSFNELQSSVICTTAHGHFME